MATSYNGWPATQTGLGIDRNFTAAGQPFPGGVRSGSVAVIFRWLIERLNTIEPIVPGWNWGYEYRPNVNNPSTLSCHSSGTAIDYNAPNHPNGARGTWSAEQVKAIRGWLAQLDGVVRWGYDFTGTKDEMHFEIIGDSASVDRVAAKLDNPGKPNDPDPEDDMPYSEQQIKELVRAGVKWTLEDVTAVDPLVIRAAVGPIVEAAAKAIVRDLAAAVPGLVRAELAKLLPTGIQADPAQFQAAKEIVHDGAKWAIEDPAVDVARFHG